MKRKVEVQKLENCSDKTPAAVDVNRLIARGVQDSAAWLNWIQRTDPARGADKFSDIALSTRLIFACIRTLGICSYCGGIMIGSLREHQFHDAVLTFLLQNRMISKKRVHTPALDEVIEAITDEKEGIFIEFDYICNYCGDDSQSMIIGAQSDSNPEVKTPRLVG